MNELVIEGKDLLLESLGHNYRYKVVRLSEQDKVIIKQAIDVLAKAGELEAKALQEQGINGESCRENKWLSQAHR